MPSSPTIQAVGLFVTLLVAILTIYSGFRNQQRLKAFELSYARRNEVLKDIEAALNTLFEILASADDERAKLIHKFGVRSWQDGLVLYHKIQGGNFGRPAELSADTYYAVLTECLKEDISPPDKLNSWIVRQTNTLGATHGFAHAEMSREVRVLTESLAVRACRYLFDRREILIKSLPVDFSLPLRVFRLFA